MASRHESPLSTPTRRRQLAPRDAPYWTELQQRLRLGYRKGATGAGVWVLREFRGGRYVRRRLGLADDQAPADGVAILSYGDAQRLALSADRPTVTSPGKCTVQRAYDDYCAARKNPLDVRERTSWDRFIGPSLGSRDIAELTSQDLARWLQAQATARGKRGQTKERGDDRDALRRARYTANRRWTLLRAVLNHAFQSDAVPSDAAWRKIKPFRNVDRPRTVTATLEQCRALLEKLQGPLLALAQAALFTGLRLGELTRLRVDDIDIPGSRLRVRHGKGERERFVPLNAEARAFFAARIEGKAPEALAVPPLHTDPVMNRVAVSRGMKTASAAAGIRPALTFHDLRRTWGSLMLNAGAPLEVIQQVLGHADMRMTRRIYAHLLDKTVEAAVQKHLPSFAVPPKPPEGEH